MHSFLNQGKGDKTDSKIQTFEGVLQRLISRTKHQQCGS